MTHPARRRLRWTAALAQLATDVVDDVRERIGDAFAAIGAATGVGLVLITTEPLGEWLVDLAAQGNR